MAGGNAVQALLGSNSGVGPAGLPAPIGDAQAQAGTVANSSGGSTSLPRVQFCIGALFLLAAAALVLLNKAGFRFSVAVG